MCRVWERIRSIPSTLRAITILCWVLGPVAVVASITPGWKDEAGNAVLLHDLWAEGSGLQVMGVGFGMLFLGTLVYKGKGKSWIRHALMLGVVAIGFSAFIIAEYKELPSSILTCIVLLPIVLGIRYLYFRREVICYFYEANIKAEQDGAHQPATRPPTQAE